MEVNKEFIKKFKKSMTVQLFEKPLDPFSMPKESYDQIIASKIKTYDSVVLLPHTCKTWKKMKEILVSISDGNIKKPDDLYTYICELRKLSTGHSFDSFKTLKTILQTDDLKFIESILAILPKIASMALKIELFYPDGKIPCLSQAKQNIVKFSKAEISSILANLFLCSMPTQKTLMTLEASFEGFYSSRSLEYIDLMKQKLRFIMNYFERIVELDMSSCITITRLSLIPSEYTKLNFPYWVASKSSLSPVEICEGKIEDKIDSVCIDFADAYVGGGNDYLTEQEQVLFLIFPELFAASTICEKMRDNEAVVIVGIEQFSSYSGSGKNIICTGKYKDPLSDKRDSFSRIPRIIVAMDAMMEMHLIESHLKRDLAKAYIGFKGDTVIDEKEARPIATGRWGCGSFKGASPIKFLIQWIAASENNRKLQFHPFGDEQLKKLDELIITFKEETVGTLMIGIIKYMLSKVGEDQQGNMIFEWLIQNKQEILAHKEQK